jgi:hypothetical protein
VTERGVWASLAAAWLLGCVYVGACSPAHTADDEAARQACYLRAEAVFATQAASCPAAWEDCPERQAILNELRAAQERCP